MAQAKKTTKQTNPKREERGEPTLQHCVVGKDRTVQVFRSSLLGFMFHSRTTTKNKLIKGSRKPQKARNQPNKNDRTYIRQPGRCGMGWGRGIYSLGCTLHGLKTVQVSNIATLIHSYARASISREGCAPSRHAGKYNLVCAVAVGHGWVR